MKIIHVAAELAPIAKVGGLGDVVHGLSRALIEGGHHVKVILPKYDTLDLKDVEGLHVIEQSHLVRFAGSVHTNTLWQGTLNLIPIILIESHERLKFFDRGQVYGCEDDIARFSYFCLAALEFIKKTACDVVHLHDWHTAMMAGLIKEVYKEIEARIIFTIHNLAYQGLCRAEDLEKIGWKNPQLKESGVYNLLKGGIVFADHVTTVSPNYAKEILTTPLGGNLQSVLQQHHRKFSGILNGIDYTYWNPETDPFLPFHYSIHTPDNKEKIKNELRKRLSLADEKSPIVGTVTRLVQQKGPELIKAALLRTLEWGGQYVVLGSIPDEMTHTHFYNLKQKLSGSAHVHLELSYDEELAHLLYAGADLFLVPSIFEPCGLTQLIAMRYGTVPLVRETGGLVDTVFDGKNGFSFGPPTAEAIHSCLDRAFDVWYSKLNVWRQLIKNGMEADFSWKKPAQEYLHIYKNF